MKKLIRYRISISKVFPAYHPSKGQPTNFLNSIMQGVGFAVTGELTEDEPFPSDLRKIHTIRGNYPLWQKRFEKINQGKAVLELYQWSGKSYNSKCETIRILTKDDGIGLERLDFLKDGDGVHNFKYPEINLHYTAISIAHLSSNDGLDEKDFHSWFKPYDLSEPLAIIHFTKFKYDTYRN